jgi:glutamate-1-semialdehyde aminotransferase
VRPDPAAAVSGRAGLADLAGRAIAATAGVTAMVGPAGRWQTAGTARAVPGVVAAEDGRGRVELELHLAAGWPPATSLQQLADQLRDRLRQSAAVAGMEHRLGEISVAFHDVLTEAPGD